MPNADTLVSSLIAGQIPEAADPQNEIKSAASWAAKRVVVLSDNLKRSSITFTRDELYDEIKNAYRVGAANKHIPVFSEPSHEEFEPRDHNDAGGVRTMRDEA